MSVLITLSRGLQAIIDDADAVLAEHKWSARPVSRASGGFYAFRTVARRTIYLHREVMTAPPGLLVDHINGNGLDNRRTNLRLVNHSGNLINRAPWSKSGFKGVSWARDKQRWQAYIYPPGGRRILLGLHRTAEAAARAYDVAAARIHGDLARLNFGSGAGQ